MTLDQALIRDVFLMKDCVALNYWPVYMTWLLEATCKISRADSQCFTYFKNRNTAGLRIEIIASETRKKRYLKDAFGDGDTSVLAMANWASQMSFCLSFESLTRPIFWILFLGYCSQLAMKRQLEGPQIRSTEMQKQE